MRMAWRHYIIATCLCMGLTLLQVEAICAQDTPPAPESQPQPEKQTPPPADAQTAQPGGNAPQDQAGKDQQGEKEVKITPREAEELFHSVDEIMAFDSKHTGLPIKKEVKRRLTSRDEVVAYLTKHMKDEDVKRLERSALVLKKFGLLPRDYDMEKLLLELLREEIAGYYDPKTKTVNLLDWVPMEEQEPVMAHELTHALQDQDVNLDKWMKKGDRDLGEMKKDPTPQDIENDEMDDAREAVLEGQAQAMMFEYALAPTGHSIASSPELVRQMEEETMTETPSTKVFNSAPIFMKESLTFPYTYGMDFVVKMIETGGKQKAYADVLANPPHTTRQIMQPETYLSGEKIEPMPVVSFSRDFKNYVKFDIGAMGEFDVALLVEQYAGKKVAKEIYPAWRGGYYYAARPKNDASAPLGLLYVSRWSNAERACEFAAIYADALQKRYTKLSAKDPARAGPTQSPDADPERRQECLKGRHEWSSEEGEVIIEENMDKVLIIESLDAGTSEALEKEVFGK
ncbi:MAG TPA: hypothetical protein VND65_22995 [Candidatus Binatia bacterium]|nr:hypothetical protein [Candidatus Binatia bacterium]